MKKPLKSLPFFHFFFLFFLGWGEGGALGIFDVREEQKGFSKETKTKDIAIVI